jgi:DNA-directed RNA polymerase subunit RPC12/RpoP
MPSYQYCSECKEFSLEFDPENKTLVCKGCGKKVTLVIRDF